MRIFRAVAVALVGLTLSLSFSACTATVNLDAAPLANDPACAEIIVRLPAEVALLPIRNTNAQATGAWGEPTAVILRCGLEPAEVSSLPCVTAGDVDWLVDESQKPSYRFITFGRTPATEVIVDSTAVAGVSALEAVAGAIQNIKATERCLG
jgi:hypothetical protein